MSRISFTLSVSVSYDDIVITVTGSPVKVTFGSCVCPEEELSLLSSPPPQAARPSSKLTAPAAASPFVRALTVVIRSVPSPKADAPSHATHQRRRDRRHS